MKKSIPEMKKSIPIIRARESEAFILGNGREREFPLTPDGIQSQVSIKGKEGVPEALMDVVD